jgi:hypothetical protein
MTELSIHWCHHHHERRVALPGVYSGYGSGSLCGGKFDTIEKCVL